MKDADTRVKTNTEVKLTPRPKMSTDDGTADGGRNKRLKDAGKQSNSDASKDEEKVNFDSCTS